MSKKILVVLALALATSLNGVARADITNSTGTNVQEGNNNARAAQRGASTSGAAVGGQVSGVVSSGRTSVDARNISKDSSVGSGDVRPPGWVVVEGVVACNAPTAGSGLDDGSAAAASDGRRSSARSVFGGVTGRSCWTAWRSASTRCWRIGWRGSVTIGCSIKWSFPPMSCSRTKLAWRRCVTISMDTRPCVLARSR